jgi:predicted Rossmann fold flavoprotein
MATIRRHQWQVRVVVGILMIFTFASPTSIRWRLFSTALTSQYQISNKIAIIGGGASGIFASIAASEHEHTIVTVLEATSKTLQKVKISGGGRCNVMHDTAKSIPAILSGYPRGNKELNGLYKKRFSPTMARDWFELRGVELKTEEDGRMFPITDSSQTIIDTLTNAAIDEGVQIQMRQKVTSILRQEDGGFCIQFKDGNEEVFSVVVLATGSAPGGYALAQSLGHNLVSPVPSLFTLNCKHDTKENGLLYGLSGISVPSARVSLSKKLFQEGPLLITHHGVSGPAVLRLSAFAAREFKEMNYRGQATINWDTTLGTNSEQIFEELWKVTLSNPKRAVASVCPLLNNSIPRRLWSSLAISSGFTPETVWGNASKKLVRSLATNLVACPLEFTGKGTFKEEFVTAGGVSLKEIQMTNMESKKCPGLFFCGELIDVDGVTGGFNFLNCWGTGFVAGHGSADYCLEQKVES